MLAFGPVVGTTGTVAESVLAAASCGALLGYMARRVIAAEVARARASSYLAAPTFPRAGAVESVSAVLLVSTTMAPSALPPAALWVLGIAGIVLAWVDGATHRLPDSITGTGLLAMLVVLAATAAGSTGEGHAFVRAVLAGGVLAGCYLAVALFSGRLGLGDVKAAATAGVALGWVGWPEVLAATVLALVLAACWGVVLILGEGEGSEMPYGPFLFAGALTVLAG